MHLTQFDHDLSQMVQAFGIIGPALGVALERAARLVVPSRYQVRGSDFAPDLILRELTVSGDDDMEMLRGVLQTALRARNAAQLKVRLEFAGINLHGTLEALDGFRILAALQVDEPKLVVGF